MNQYRGSHEDFDLYVVPVTPEAKQMRDTVNTLRTLRALGVGPERIRIVFNKVEEGEDVPSAFGPVFACAEDFGCTTDVRAVIYQSELYQMLANVGRTVTELANDETDWKAELRAAPGPEEKSRAARMLSLKRLAGSAERNLDEVFQTLVA
jgi:hypothetical protein